MIETKMATDKDPFFIPPAKVVDAIHAAIERYKIADQVWLQSFDHRTLAEMQKRNPAIKRILLNPRTRLDDYVTPAKKLAAYAQLINFRIIEKRDVDALHAAGIKVISGTTSDPVEWKKLKALGVDAILTDDPLGLLATN
jgi:glycerophosphoryl diester phosphodiesterase